MGVVRNTKAIEELTSLFLDDEKALSVVEIVNKLSSKMNKTTVYRALKRLEDDEVIHSFIDRDGLKCYAKNRNSNKKEVHPHFHCKSCGTSICVPFEYEIPKYQSHKIESAQVLLYGKCDKCL
jgi:Fur family ferric uptake transcriptional regulator